MRQRSGLLNRAWLAVIGLVVLLGGIVAALISLGLLARITAAIGIRLGVPVTSSKVLGSSVGAFFDQPVVAPGPGAYSRPSTRPCWTASPLPCSPPTGCSGSNPRCTARCAG
jgi:hypothetical protein